MPGAGHADFNFDCREEEEALRHRSRLRTRHAAAAILLLMGLTTPTAWGQSAGPFDTFTVPPCRVLNTKKSNPLGPIPANGTLRILVAGDLTGGGTVNQGGAANCGVPDAATGVFVNVIAVNAGGPGYLTVYPFNTSLPPAGTLYFTTGQKIANGALVPTCTPAGSCAFDVNITMGPAKAHMMIDITGYLLPTP